MSGRGGRSGGNRGRNRRFAGRSSNRGIKSEIKKNLSDYNYYVGSAKQASDYESTTEFLINHIKKTFEFGNDIGSALKDLKPVDTDQWKPSMQVSISPTIEHRLWFDYCHMSALVYDTHHNQP